jgi:hypothetical protein
LKYSGFSIEKILIIMKHRFDRSYVQNINDRTNATSSISSPSASTLQWLIFNSGLFYFSIVFAVGFVLGTLRVFLAVPYFGARVAELLEMPFMLVAIIATAYWLVRRLAIPPTLGVRLGMGLVALGFLLAADFGAVLYLRGISIPEYFATRDPLAGTLYYSMLGIFAMMPWLISRRKVG